MKSIFEQFFNVSNEKLGEIVVLTCFDRLGDFKRIYKNNILCEFMGYYKGLTLDFDGRLISVIFSGSGDSRVGDAVLALNESRCKALIYCGTAGGLGSGISRGDLFVPREAVIGEGFSRYYKDINANIYDNISTASPDMVMLFEKFENKSMSFNVKVLYSKIFTIDSIFAETKEFLGEISQNGCAAIDMETSAFYTAAQVIRRKCLAVHYISDLPQEEQNYDMLRKECIRSYIKMPHLLIEFIRGFYDDII